MKYSLTVLLFIVSFSVYGGNGIRPTMVDFKISMDQNSNALVEWISGEEFNLDFYVIEKSNDNRYFQELSTVKAKSEEGALNQYSVVDRNLNYGASYYRLKYVDDKGDWNLSLTLQVNKLTPHVFSLLPCPESKFVHVELDKKGAQTIEIFHIATGDKMLTYNIQGNKKAAIPTYDLENGQYWMKINFERRSQSLRFIKQCLSGVIVNKVCTKKGFPQDCEKPFLIFSRLIKHLRIVINLCSYSTKKLILMKCSVFIATSVDGFIAKKDGDVSWLHAAGNGKALSSAQADMGLSDYLSSVDCMIMGRKCMEIISSMDLTPEQWFYGDLRIIVLSNTIKEVPGNLKGKVEMYSGDLLPLISNLEQEGFKHAYVDGGATIQSFINLKLINEMTITKAPVLLGEGIPLFAKSSHDINLEEGEAIAFANDFIQLKYKVKYQ